MTVDKMSISFDADLGGAVRASATGAGQPLSSWLADAAATKLRAEALAAFLGAWEAEFGKLSPAEIAGAERELDLSAGANIA